MKLRLSYQLFILLILTPGPACLCSSSTTTLPPDRQALTAVQGFLYAKLKSFGKPDESIGFYLQYLQDDGAAAEIEILVADKINSSKDFSIRPFLLKKVRVIGETTGSAITLHEIMQVESEPKLPVTVTRNLTLTLVGKEVKCSTAESELSARWNKGNIELQIPVPLAFHPGDIVSAEGLVKEELLSCLITFDRESPKVKCDGVRIYTFIVSGVSALNDYTINLRCLVGEKIITLETNLNLTL